jgi:hypothetical protein
MWFTNGSYGWAQFTFSGHDVGSPAVDKGTAYYADSAGYWYGAATSVVVTSASATLSVTVTSSTHPAVPVGSTHVFTFYDLGEPGTSDYFTYGAPPGGPIVAEAGNIQLHYYD